ncbi:MAG TPA: hypothetical protein DHW82_03375 [Spirochaetia bacterium]|nr:MAG: hypothetical protein A2Y41_06575 [Spirochaetes bacterium GWB1_36_13]HCL56034.1 hypothetical protein [Spirochaetia bacterium]
MLRKIIKPFKKDFTIHIPDEYINKRIEILVLPFEEAEESKSEISKNIIEETAGLFAHSKIDPLKWQKEIRSEWDHRNC